VPVGQPQTHQTRRAAGCGGLAKLTSQGGFGQSTAFPQQIKQASLAARKSLRRPVRAGCGIDRVQVVRQARRRDQVEGRP